MQAPEARLVDQRIGPGQHAAFAAGDVLRRVEREAHRAPIVPGGKRSDRGSPEPRAERMRGVLDDRDLEPAAELKELVQLDGVAAVVHRQDGADVVAAGLEHLADGIGVDVEGVALHVDEERMTAGLLDHVCGGTEGQRCRHDVATRRDAQGLERDVHRTGTGVDRQRGRATDLGCELLFELLDSRARGQPARPDDLDVLLEGVIGDRRVGEGQERVTSGTPS